MLNCGDIKKLQAMFPRGSFYEIIMAICLRKKSKRGCFPGKKFH